MNIVDYKILAQQLTNPIGNNRYHAIIEFVYIKTENGNKKINTGLKETYGRTEDEARAKMKLRFDDWKNNQ